MNEINVIQIPFFEWTLPNDIVDDSLDFLNTLKYHKNGDIESTELFDFQPLTNYVTTACVELQNKIYQTNEQFQIVPTIFWANKTNFLGKHHRHDHVNSLYSGIVYLTSDENSGATRFYYSNIYRYYESNLFTLSENKSTIKNNFDYYPQKGKMIIFPSNIEHETIANKKSERVTIAFNTFIKGVIGSSNHKTLLNL